MSTSFPESAERSKCRLEESNVTKQNKNAPIPFLEFVQNIAPIVQDTIAGKVHVKALQAPDRKAALQRHGQRGADTTTHDQYHDVSLKDPLPLPSTPRLTVESPSSESESVQPGDSQLHMDDSNDEHSSYYSDSCAIEREPRRRQAGPWDVTLPRTIRQPLEMMIEMHKQSHPSGYTDHPRTRRSSMAGGGNRPMKTDLAKLDSCPEYDGDDEGRGRPR
ncbi:uncharacterized protein K489DRAFT_214884 [Dissoconium aciculare CBS 342.82]|uniref:Uncharacterized protein n=1 Tax=Dissoconium aciculare CBS 342.82 TaxID=1314786 RepID=A0A6J3M478_9PEZI|nr:uncharacterized protein K489DRAFT_214884 [Dissoconium aciculare CBS 342.82]KAF1822703.1 hypothetical protein K489DRAFT_214884 [Dissoconium aciculare CBS 342.82]